MDVLAVAMSIAMATEIAEKITKTDQYVTSIYHQHAKTLLRVVNIQTKNIRGKHVNYLGLELQASI